MALPKTFAKAKASLTEQWSDMLITGLQSETDRLARRGLANKQRYLAVQKATGVPWYFVLALHARESGCDFKKHLHNGDPLTRKTTHVPAGRPLGPVPRGGFTWEASAIDALKMKGLHTVTVWSVERMAWEAERYNGTGYRMRGKPSPYVWAGTNNYAKGKFVADHVYDANHVDGQPGVMVVMRRVAELDPSFAMASEGDKKSIRETVKSSPSLGAQINSFFGILATGVYASWDWVTGASRTVVDAVGGVIGVIPDATTTAQSAISQVDAVASTLRVPLPVIFMMTFSAGALLFAIIRLIRQKRVA